MGSKKQCAIIFKSDSEKTKALFTWWESGMLEQQTQTSWTWCHLVNAAVDDDDGDAAAAAAAEASVPAPFEPETQRGVAAGSVWWLLYALAEVRPLWTLLHHHC